MNALTGKFADKYWDFSRRASVMDKIESAFERRAWYSVHDVSQRLGGVYIIRRRYGGTVEDSGTDNLLEPAIARWEKSGWVLIHGRTDPERVTVCHSGWATIDVLGKTPILY